MAIIDLLGRKGRAIAKNFVTIERIQKHIGIFGLDGVVPEGKDLVLGDNRDNSANSRVIGFVPHEEIIVRTDRVVFSLNYDNYYLPRLDRLGHQL